MAKNVNVEINNDGEDEEEEDDEDVYTGATKTPIKLAKVANPNISKRTAAEEKRINLLKEKYKSVQLDGKPISEIIGNSADIKITNAISTVNNVKVVGGIFPLVIVFEVTSLDILATVAIVKLPVLIR